MKTIGTLFFLSALTICAFAQEPVKSIHVLVALCDNVNQGIIPVPAKLGNGDKPDDNLYWGALYGVRTYFLPQLNKLGCRPILLTTGLMAPEAYTLEAALSGWLAHESPKQIRDRAARAYHAFQKCGLTAAQRLFRAE